LGCTLLIASAISYPIALFIPLSAPIWFYLRNLSVKPLGEKVQITGEKSFWRDQKRLILCGVSTLASLLVLSMTLYNRFFVSSLWYKPGQDQGINIYSAITNIVAKVPYYAYGAVLAPRNLTPAHYPYEDMFIWEELVGLLICSLLIFKMFDPRKRREIISLVLVSILMLIPILGITELPCLPPDRYTYLISIPILLALAICIKEPMLKRKSVMIALSFLITTQCVWNIYQQRNWQNTENLFAHMKTTEVVVKADEPKFFIERAYADKEIDDEKYIEAACRYEEMRKLNLKDINTKIDTLNNELVIKTLLEAKAGNIKALNSLTSLKKLGLLKTERKK
jgi:hypothetical protein